MQLEHKGSGKTEDLVMIHGLAANMAFWLQDFTRAFSKHFRVTIYDLRGHGRSPVTQSGYSPEKMAEDLEDLFGALNIDQANVMAHSFGGAVAMNFAANNPKLIKSLVIADTHISQMRDKKAANKWEVGYKIAKILSDCGVNLSADDPHFGYKLLTEIAYMRQSGAIIPEPLRPWVAWIFGGDNKRPAEKWLSLMNDTKAKSELLENDNLSEERLKKIDLPILCMYGEKSQSMATGSYLKSVWPNAKLDIIKDAGHFFPRSKPQEVIQLCEVFWQELAIFNQAEVNLVAGAKQL